MKKPKKQARKRQTFTCWHCGGDPTVFEVFDCMDATCHLCHAPFDKNRCAEFKFTPKKRLVRE